MMCVYNSTYYLLRILIFPIFFFSILFCSHNSQISLYYLLLSHFTQV